MSSLALLLPTSRCARAHNAVSSMYLKVTGALTLSARHLHKACQPLGGRASAAALLPNQAALLSDPP